MLNLSNSDTGSLEEDTDKTRVYTSNPGEENYQINPRGQFSSQNNENCTESLEPVKGTIIAMLIAILFWIVLGILLIR